MPTVITTKPDYEAYDAAAQDAVDILQAQRGCRFALIGFDTDGDNFIISSSDNLGELLMMCETTKALLVDSALQQKN